MNDDDIGTPPTTAETPVDEGAQTLYTQTDSITEQPASPPEITFWGNNYDLMSVVSASIAGSTLFACGTCSVGFYCLPFLPLILGIVGLFSLKDSVDHNRTKMLSWISISIGLIFVLLIVALMLFYILYFAFIFFIIAAESGGGF